MIVVKVCMWPGGHKEQEYEIARAYIANDGKRTRETNSKKGDYIARFMQSNKFNPNKVWKTSSATNIDRVRRGVWDILYVALHSIKGMEKRNRNSIDRKKG